ncbi:MAG: hypothetical protein V1929_02770 [bacterium]
MRKNNDLGSISIPEMYAEIKRRNRQLVKLHKRRKSLVKQLKATEEAISCVGGEERAVSVPAAGGSGRRFKNKLTLADAIFQVLHKDKPTRVADIMGGVQKVGYRSASKTFRTIIFQTLAKDKRFKQAGRGLYILRS